MRLFAIEARDVFWFSFAYICRHEYWARAQHANKWRFHCFRLVRHHPLRNGMQAGQFNRVRYNSVFVPIDIFICRKINSMLRKYQSWILSIQPSSGVACKYICLCLVPYSIVDHVSNQSFIINNNHRCRSLFTILCRVIITIILDCVCVPVQAVPWNILFIDSNVHLRRRRHRHLRLRHRLFAMLNT